MSHDAAKTPLWAVFAAAILSLLPSSRSQINLPREAKASQSPHDESYAHGADTDYDRGRGASSPTDIPPIGWKDVALRVYGSVGEDRVLAIAAGVTFYVLLALFPAIAGLIALYGLFADAGKIERHVLQRRIPHPPRLLGVVQIGLLELEGEPATL